MSRGFLSLRNNYSKSNGIIIPNSLSPPPASLPFPLVFPVLLLSSSSSLAVIPDPDRGSSVFAFVLYRRLICTGARRWIPAFAGMTERGVGYPAFCHARSSIKNVKDRLRSGIQAFGGPLFGKTRDDTLRLRSGQAAGRPLQAHGICV